LQKPIVLVAIIIKRDGIANKKKGKKTQKSINKYKKMMK
jgi:hypothetical protein